MSNDTSKTEFHGVLGPFVHQLLQEKHACGYRYRKKTRVLHRLDDFLVQERLEAIESPRSLARHWLILRSISSSEQLSSSAHRPFRS